MMTNKEAPGEKVLMVMPGVWWGSLPTSSSSSVFLDEPTASFPCLLERFPLKYL